MIPFTDLICALESFQAILVSRNSKFGFPLNGDGLEANVQYILRVHSALVTVQSQSNTLVILVNFQPGDTVQHMVFQHYANQFLAIVLPFSLSSLLYEAQVKSERCLSNDASPLTWSQIQVTNEMVEEYTFLKQLLQEDFIYHRGFESQVNIQFSFKVMPYYSRF